MSPRASITNYQIHVTYDARSIKLPDSTVESQLEEWKVSFDTTVLDQLAVLDTNEYEALDAVMNRSEQTLEWIQFGDYRTIIQGIEHVKARTLTIIMSGVPHPTPKEEKKYEPEEKKRDEKKREESKREESKSMWIKVWGNELCPVFRQLTKLKTRFIESIYFRIH